MGHELRLEQSLRDKQATRDRLIREVLSGLLRRHADRMLTRRQAQEQQEHLERIQQDLNTAEKRVENLTELLRNEQNGHRIEKEAAELERDNLHRQAQEQLENHEHVQQDLHHSQNIVDNVRCHAQEQQANLEGVQQDLHDAEERDGNLTESLGDERSGRRIEQEEARLERGNLRRQAQEQQELFERVLNERTIRNFYTHLRHF